MVCIYCGFPTRVINSRLQTKSNSIWRRRRCLNCVNVFTTHEVVDWASAFVVRDLKNAQLMPFSRDKLFMSIYKSCGHRPKAIGDASALVATIIQKLLIKKGHHQAISTKTDIIETAQSTLDRFDKAAAMSYNAYHQS